MWTVNSKHTNYLLTLRHINSWFLLFYHDTMYASIEKVFMVKINAQTLIYFKNITNQPKILTKKSDWISTLGLGRVSTQQYSPCPPQPVQTLCFQRAARALPIGLPWNILSSNSCHSWQLIGIYWDCSLYWWALKSIRTDRFLLLKKGWSFRLSWLFLILEPKPISGHQHFSTPQLFRL